MEMFSRIRTKILALFILNVAIWLTFFGVAFYWITSRLLETQMEKSLKGTASVLASQWDGSLLIALEPGMENTPLYQSFLERLQRLKRQTNLDAIYIATPERTNIVSTAPGMRIGQSIPRLDLLQSELQHVVRGTPSASVLIRVGDRLYKSALAPIYAGDQPAAILMVDISPAYLATMQTFRHSMILLAAIALICCILTAHFFSRTITTPISRMVGGVEEIGKAHYEQPLTISGSDELSHLAGSIERMRQNILHRDTQMKMMLSGIAHEIRNPLGGIELFAGILAKEKLQREQQEYLERIQSEVQNLKRLLNEFLEYARPQKLDRSRFPVSPLLAEIQMLFSEELKATNADWKTDIQPDVENICADRAKIKQALLNIYKNALQALPQDNGKIHTAVHKNGAGVILEISNNLRVPLDFDISAKIFEPFFTTKEKGMGLGLPLAKGIVEAHGGELKMVEKDSSRVTFAIRLPEEREVL